IAGDLHAALGDDHVATVYGHALAVVQFGAVGLDADRLIAVRGQGPGGTAGEGGAQGDKQGKSPEGEVVSELHAGLLRWTAGVSGCLSNALSFLWRWSPRWRPRF